MQVTLFMAVSLDGYIAKEDNNVDWISKSQWVDYEKILKKAKVAIVGRKTYELMNDEEFLEECLFYVLSHDKNLKPKFKNAIPTNLSPKKLLKELKDKGYKEAVVIGGVTLNSSFLEAALIDELIVDIEPALIGKGIPLFLPKKLEIRLKLINMIKNEDDIVQLHYEVIK